MGQPMANNSASQSVTNHDDDADGEEAVPLAVWPCAQTTAQRQRAGTYLPECREHPGKMLPDLASRIIRSYSRAGDLICDPMCGTGTTIVEAARLGRCAVGVDVEARWVDLAARNLDHILDDATRPLADVRGRRRPPATPRPRRHHRPGRSGSRRRRRTPARSASSTSPHGSRARGSVTATPSTTRTTPPTSVTPAATPTATPWPPSTRRASRCCGPVDCWSPSPRTPAAVVGSSTSPPPPEASPPASGSPTCNTSSPCMWASATAGWSRDRRSGSCTTSAAPRAAGHRVHLVAHEDVLVFAKPATSKGRC